LHYTIGVRRRFGLGWRKFSVTQHWMESSDYVEATGETVTFPMRLVLNCADGGTRIVPNIAGRELRIYPDYRRFMSWIEDQKRVIEAERAAIAQTEA